MEKTLSATEAKTHFGTVIREAAEKGQTFIVERSGIPRIAIVPFEEFERMKGRHKLENRGVMLRRIRTLKKRLHDRLTREGMELADVEAMIDRAREQRDGRILGGLRWCKFRFATIPRRGWQQQNGGASGAVGL